MLLQRSRLDVEIMDDVEVALSVMLRGRPVDVTLRPPASTNINWAAAKSVALAVPLTSMKASKAPDAI